MSDKALWESYQHTLHHADTHLAKPAELQSALRRVMPNNTVYTPNHIYCPIDEGDVASNPSAIRRYIETQRIPA